MITALAQSWKMRTEKVRFVDSKRSCRIDFSVSVESQVVFVNNTKFSKLLVFFNTLPQLGFGDYYYTDLDFSYLSFLRGRFFLVCSRSAHTWWWTLLLNGERDECIEKLFRYWIEGHFAIYAYMHICWKILFASVHMRVHWWCAHLCASAKVVSSSGR